MDSRADSAARTGIADIADIAVGTAAAEASAVTFEAAAIGLAAVDNSKAGLAIGPAGIAVDIAAGTAVLDTVAVVAVVHMARAGMAAGHIGQAAHIDWADRAAAIDWRYCSALSLAIGLEAVDYYCSADCYRHLAVAIPP